MAFSVEIKNPDITIEPECTQKVIFSVDIPESSQARTKDVGGASPLLAKDPLPSRRRPASRQTARPSCLSGPSTS